MWVNDMAQALEDRVRIIELELELLKSKFSAGVQKDMAAIVNATTAAPGPAIPEIADAADLDGQWGNEPVRKDPKDKYWKGQSYVGVRLSDCPPEYLDALAKYKDACAYMNTKEGSPEKAKYAGYDKRDAARARGWAARLRAGWKSPSANGHAAKATAVKPVDFDNDADEGDVLPF